MPTGPDARVKITDAYAALVARTGPSPQAPVNRFTMLYIYLLSRLLVLRQQQLDFQEGFKWNALVHRKPGEVDWPNPNLDVAYSEAWVAVDEQSCLVVSVPKITGRYYTVQFLNGWGETVANITNGCSRSTRTESSPSVSKAVRCRFPRVRNASTCR